MMKRRILGLFLCLVMVLSLVPSTALAAEEMDSGTCGDNLTWTLDNTGTLTISGTGAMDVMLQWNGRRDDIKSVVIGDGVTSIGDRAFRNCRHLASIVIPNGVTSIGDDAFAGCVSLTTVTIPDSVTSIGDGAFGMCVSLTTMTIPDSVTSIGDDAFSMCESLTTVTIPNSVTSIGSDAFKGTPWAKNQGDFLIVNGTLIQYQGKGGDVIIPDGVERIKDYLFYCNYDITSLTIPDSVTSIGNFAFYNCSSLKTVIYTGDQSEWEKISIGNGNDVLNKVQIAVVGSGTCGDNLTWTVDKYGTLRVEGMGEMDAMPSWLNYRDDIKTAVISDGVTNIGYDAFHNCSNLESITIPDSVTCIGGYAFAGCINLKDVNIPAKVMIIDEFGFSDCINLESITLPASVLSIKGMAFNGCAALKSITFAGDAPTTLGDDIFRNVTATAYYPANNETWKDVINNGYGGILTWEASHAMHAKGVFPGKEATCTETGLTDGVICLTCREVIVEREVIPAKGHKGVWMDNNAEATCCKTGVKEGAICSECGYVLIAEKTLPIDPNNHKNIVTDKAVAATYTKTGLTEGSHCKDCGKVLTAQKTVPMKKLAQAKISSITNTSTGITVKWGKVTGATAYQVYRKVGTGSWKLIKTTTSTSLSNTGLTNGTKYQYKVRAVAKNSAGKVVNTGEFSVIKTMYRLTRPTLASGTKNIATRKIVVKWNKNTKATGYQVKYVKGSTAKTVTVKGASTLTKTLSSLTKGSTYKVYVRSYKTVSGTNYYSAWSAYKSVKVAK